MGLGLTQPDLSFDPKEKKLKNMDFKVKFSKPRGGWPYSSKKISRTGLKKIYPNPSLVKKQSIFFTWVSSEINHYRQFYIQTGNHFLYILVHFVATQSQRFLEALGFNPCQGSNPRPSDPQPFGHMSLKTMFFLIFQSLANFYSLKAHCFCLGITYYFLAPQGQRLPGAAGAQTPLSDFQAYSMITCQWWLAKFRFLIVLILQILY